MALPTYYCALYDFNVICSVFVSLLLIVNSLLYYIFDGEIFCCEKSSCTMDLLILSTDAVSIDQQKVKLEVSAIELSLRYYFFIQITNGHKSLLPLFCFLFVVIVCIFFFFFFGIA